MNRTELVVATAAILFAAFSMGWFASWLVHRLTRASKADLSEMDRMAQALHEAEEIRDEAIAYVEGRERDLTTKVRTLEAERRAAMEALEEARGEAEALRAWIERTHAGENQPGESVPAQG